MDDEEVEARLSSDLGLSKEQIEACLDVRLPDGHGSLSKAAIDKILPILRDQGLIYYDAVREAGFGEANRYDPNAPLSDRLDYYGKALAGHVMGASGKPEDRDEARYGSISNPTFILRSIRSGSRQRDHPPSRQARRDCSRDCAGTCRWGQTASVSYKNCKRNQDNNEVARDALSELGVIDSRQNSRQKFQYGSSLRLIQPRGLSVHRGYSLFPTCLVTRLKLSTCFHFLQR